MTSSRPHRSRLSFGTPGPTGHAELAGELLRELAGGVQAFLRPGVQRVHVDPLDELARGGRG